VSRRGAVVIHSHAADSGAAGYSACVEDTGLSLWINWVSVPIFLALAIAVALYARHVSGRWMRPWIGLKPVWWFVLVLLVPWIGLPLLVVQLILHRQTPGAITGRHTSG
jgi:hypothetical protein